MWGYFTVVKDSMKSSLGRGIILHLKEELEEFVNELSI